MNARQIMTADELRRALVRISHEIVEKHGGTDGLALVGIQRRGVPLAERLAEAIAAHEGVHRPWAPSTSPSTVTISRWSPASRWSRAPICRST